ncbi:hypothetical protein QBC40DRAFT_198450 [Triangularia verruculosa]|uniref:SP-RING-type domain-containing protein n=1 Tax=Triangularia verruculosa TaxID=2587418 RepID=A0AAN6XPF1_9PEZI|nr:hypothetical protein QBC40DRAFT_198450 [Triangularia verruculosa]
MAPNTNPSNSNRNRSLPDPQIASSNATANAFLGARPQPSWLNPTSTSTASNTGPAKRGRLRKYNPELGAVPLAVVQPRPQPQLPSQPPQHQTGQVQPAQTILPSPAPTDEPSPALSNALDSPNPLPASLPDAPTLAPTMMPAFGARNPSMTNARFELDPASQEHAVPQAQETWSLENQNMNQASLTHAPVPPTSDESISNGGGLNKTAGIGTGLDGARPETRDTNSPALKRRRIESTAQPSFHGRNFLANLEQHVQSHGGMDCMNPQLDRPRLHLLNDACERNDYFFLALHQLHAIWSLNQYNAHQILELNDIVTIQTIDAGFSTVGEIIRKNDHLTKGNRFFFASFPGSVQEMQKYPVYCAAIRWVVSFLQALVHEHAPMTLETCNRRYPYLLDELQGRLQCHSPIMREILFTANRRRLGIRDGAHAQAMDKAFKDDQERRIREAGIPIVSIGKTPDDIMRLNMGLVAHFKHVVRAVFPNLQLSNQPPLRYGVQSPPVLPSQQLPPSRATPINSAPASPLVQYQVISPYQPPHQATAAQQQHMAAIQQQQSAQHAAQLYQRQQQWGQQAGQVPPAQRQQGQQQQMQPQQFQQQQIQQRQIQSRQREQQLHHQRMFQQLQAEQQRRPFVAPIDTQVGQSASPLMRRESLAAVGTPVSSALPQPVLTRPQPVPAGAQRNSRGTPQRATPTSRQSDMLIPPKDTVIPRPDWPHEPTDRRSLQMSLHQSHCRSPKRVPKDGNPERLLQAMGRFAVQPTLVRPRNMVYDFAFPITQDQLDLAVKTIRPEGTTMLPMAEHFDGALRWRIRCCKAGPSKRVPSEHEWATKEMCWPRNIFMRFNGRTLEARRQTHNGKDLATELTDDVICGNNTLAVVVPVPPEGSVEESYFIAVEVIETLGERNIARHVWTNGLLPEEHTLQIIKKRLTPSSDDDGLIIEAPDLSIDMADPFMAKIFTIPARGASCTHLECFDLQTWLDTRETKKMLKCFHSAASNCGCPNPSPSQAEPSNPDKWRCPICHQDARPKSLRIDEFLYHVREQLAQQGKLQARSIHVKADGSWTAVVEDEDDDLSDTEPPAATSASSTRKRKASSTPAATRRTEVRREPEIIELD